MVLIFTAAGIVLLLLGFWRAPWWYWVAGVAAPLAVAALLLIHPTGLVVFMAAVALVAALVLGMGSLRRRCLTGPFLRRVRGALPRLSETEQQALRAGTVGWDGDLFSGSPNWDRLLCAPPAHLRPDEQEFLDGPVETLCRMVDDWRVTHHEHDLPKAAWEFIRTRGFFGMVLPSVYGGLGFSSTAHSEVVLKLATHSVTAAVTVMVPNSLGPGKLLLRYGTEAQRQHYLPRLARGLEIPCFALTGPRAGSDAGAIPDTGVVCRGRWQGEEVLGLRLNWDKRYITLAPVATLIGLAFRCLDPDGLLGGPADRGITLVLVPRTVPGVQIGARHLPMNVPFMNGPTSGRDVFLPLTQIIGERGGIGQGWRMLMETLAEGRGISLPALATGAAKSASRFTGAYARLRRQFDRPIGHFEGIEEALARIAALTYQMDAARLLTVAALDHGERPAVVSAIVKYHLTERYRRIVNDAMDVEGGRGICMGPSNVLAPAYQAIPIAITVEGANILTRSMIIFGQGAIRCHPWVLKEIDAVQDPDSGRGLVNFDRALVGHARFVVQNACRSLLLGLTGGRLARAPPGPTRRHFQRLSWMSAVLALTADAAMMTLGGAMKRHERLSARLADVLSELYLASAVLKRFHDDGAPRADDALVNWALQDSLNRMQESLRALYRNLPNRPLAGLLRAICFPTGMRCSAPSDRDDHAAAGILLTPSPTRDRLTRGVFIPSDAESPGQRIEQALQQAAELEPLERRLDGLRRVHGLESGSLASVARSAYERGLIAEADWRRTQVFEDMTDALIQVDAFAGWGGADSEQHVVNPGAERGGGVPPRRSPTRAVAGGSS